ncbi:Phosphatidylserine decarboxylase-like protein 2 [Elsinoe fawcettii]|nr:Phosphatidylserine decarboxylase-like protein 2 [Elsinoe fawcettii]
MPIIVRLGMHLLFTGSMQAKLLGTSIAKHLLEQETRSLGDSYDSPDSRRYIEPFVKQFKLEKTLLELAQPDIRKYATFNDFFSRALRSDARPIDSNYQEDVLLAVADSRLTVYISISQAAHVWIKGYGFTLAAMIVSEPRAQAMGSACLAIHRLAPQNYHRWHSPIAGVIEEIIEIPGTYYTVDPQAIKQESTLDVFCQNRRSVTRIKQDENKQDVIVVAIGAMLVGSIQLLPENRVGARVNRGQTLGKFQYGGSTVVVGFPQASVAFDEDLGSNSYWGQCETQI